MFSRRFPLAYLVPALTIGVWAVPRCAVASSAADVRRQISAGLNTAFPGTPAGRREQAREFLKLYAAAADLPPTDRARWQLRLKSRLSRLAQAIDKDRLLPAPSSVIDMKPGPTPSPGTAASPQQAGLSGGGPQDDGQALVELIQATIAPESWDVHGGPGTIQYWPAWHVLVVRQTDDVHERIGGVVHGLRK